MKSNLIFIDGVEGSGKSTTISALTQKLTELGKTWKVVKFPACFDNDVFSRLLRSRLFVDKGDVPTKQNVVDFSLFLANALLNYEKIVQYLNEGIDYVICDRSIVSIFVYQRDILSVYEDYDDIMVDILEVICDILLNIPDVNVNTFIFYAEEQVLKNRISARDKNNAQNKINFHRIDDLVNRFRKDEFLYNNYRALISQVHFIDTTDCETSDIVEKILTS